MPNKLKHYPKAQEKKAERIRRLAIFMLENPDLSRKELAERWGVSHAYMDDMIQQSELLNAIRGSASRRIAALIPLAVKGMQDSITSSNAKIKYMSSHDLLKSEKILGPDRVDVTVTDNSSKTIEELQQQIKEAQEIPAPTIDVEVIG